MSALQRPCRQLARACVDQTRRVSLVFVLCTVVALSPSHSAAQSAATTAAKRDSVRKADSLAKITKTTTSKPASGTTTAKPTTTTAAPKTTTKAPAATPAAKPAATGTARPTTSTTPAKGKAATATAGEPVVTTFPFDDGVHTLSFYAGASSAGLGFGTGPVVGAVWRLAAPTRASRLRADFIGAHYSQTPPDFGGSTIAQQASLTHVGATMSVDWSPVERSFMRPYLSVGGGVMRFQASGPAGTNSTIANGVFASTTDAAAIVGLGLQLNARIFVEARFITVGDFHAIPFTAGVRF